MCHLIRLACVLLGCLGATPALAIDASYHTWDGFSETVDAFHLVAMIFGDPRYETLVVIIAVVGIAFGADHRAGNHHAGASTQGLDEPRADQPFKARRIGTGHRRQGKQADSGQ